MSDQYRVRFERIGQSRGLMTWEGEARDADHLAEQVYRFAQPRIRSKHFEVTVDIAGGRCWIEGGRFGEGEITRVTPHDGGA